MQRIETLRHGAERLEKAAEHWPSPWRDLSLHIAGRWRRMADQLYVSRGVGAA
jgi:hypothetical protein